jgi:two-component sensor histidine kinase
VLVQSGWREAPLSGILENTLEPHLRPGHDRVDDDCRGITLRPAAAMGLTLVLHELATNAAKYGALSVEGGRLQVRCLRDDGDERLRLVWEETGGPGAAPPENKGFGLTMIENIMQNELEGEIAVEFRKEGLRVDARFPIKGD